MSKNNKLYIGKRKGNEFGRQTKELENQMSHSWFVYIFLLTSIAQFLWIYISKTEELFQQPHTKKMEKTYRCKMRAFNNKRGFCVCVCGMRMDKNDQYMYIWGV